MAPPCYYHPDAPATTVCVQCGMPICDACRDTVSGKDVCNKCVGAIRARLEGQMAAGTLAPGTAYAPSTEPATQMGIAPPARAMAAPPASSPMGLLVGAGLGALVGVLGAVLLDKFTFYTHIELGYINALVGFAIGYAVLFGSKQGGLTTGIIGGVLALASSLLGYYLLMGDELGKDGIHASAPIMMRVFPIFLKHLNILDWLIMAIGVYGGFKTPYRAVFRSR